LTAEEIEDSIIQNILHHLDESIAESRALFKLVDQDSDGVVTWNEYHYHFLVNHQLMPEDKARMHDEHEHENMDGKRTRSLFVIDLCLSLSMQMRTKWKSIVMSSIWRTRTKRLACPSRSFWHSDIRSTIMLC
jgi:hypothetical protein